MDLGDYKEGELNFAQEISDSDMEPTISGNALMTAYGEYIKDCDCENKTRIDYALCTPVTEGEEYDPEYHVSQ